MADTTGQVTTPKPYLTPGGQVDWAKLLGTKPWTAATPADRELSERQREALERQRQGEPMKWWEYLRGGQPTPQAWDYLWGEQPTPQTWEDLRGRQPTFQPFSYLQGLLGQDTQQQQQHAKEWQEALGATDWELWAFEELKHGLNAWWTDAGESWQDTGETAGEQFQKKGWRRVTESVKHVAMGLANIGLLKIAAPLLNQGEMLVERWAIGPALRNIAPMTDEAASYLFSSSIQSAMTHAMPVGLGAPETFPAEEFKVTGPSINQYIEETYGHDEELLKKAQIAATNADRISFTWGMGYGEALSETKFNKWKKIHDRLMTEAETREDTDRILKEEQNLVFEVMWGYVFDPFNVNVWLGLKPIQTRASQKVVELATQPIDETLDFAAAARKVTSWYKTPQAQARKVGEIVHDRMAVYLGTQAETLDDIPTLLRKFLADPDYDSVHGQLVKRTVESMDIKEALEGVDKAEDMFGAVERVVENLQMVAKKKELDIIKNTKWGKRAVELSEFSQKWSARQKIVLSPLLLGYNVQYMVGNVVDNLRNIMTRCGWQRIPGASFDEYMGFNRTASEAFFTDNIGAMPERMSRGFAATPAEIGVDTSGSETAVALWKRAWDWIKTGPTLKVASENEANMSALAITQSYLTRWQRNWNDAVFDLPPDLLRRVQAADPDLMDFIQTAHVGAYNFDEVLDTLAQTRKVAVEGAEVTGRLRSVGWYLQQLTNDERAALTSHPDLLAQVKKLSGVTSEADRVRVLDELSDMVSSAIGDVAKTRHLDDLQAVGWAHQKADILRQTEAVTHRFQGNPLIQEIVAKGDDAHDFDLLRRVADHFGTDVYDFLEPMDEEVFSLVHRGGTPAELWEYYNQAYPFMKKYYPDFDELQELLDLAARDGTAETMQMLTDVGTTYAPTARDEFWTLYKQLMPYGRTALRQEFPEARAIVESGGSYTADAIVEFLPKFRQWIAQHPKLFAEDVDELQHATTLAKQYMWYKLDPKSWTSWATSNWEIDRLPDTIPNVYDIYRRYKEPLESAIQKLSARTFRDLSSDMKVSPQLWDEITGWFKATVRKEMELTQYGTMRQALWDRDYAILDYGDKTILDSIASLFVPYVFWPVHSTWNWIKYTIDNPQIMSKLFILSSKIEDQAAKDPLMPERLRGWTPLGLEGIAKFLAGEAWTADTETYWKPERILVPLELMPVWGDVYLPDTYQDIARGREWIFINNMWNLSPFVTEGGALLANRLLPYLEENHPALAETVRRYVPNSALVTTASKWSATRGIRGGSIVLDGLFERFGITIPPEGWNPEGFISDALGLGLGRVQPNEVYWRYQWLANLAGTGEITSEEATYAFEHNEGRAWELATRKAAEQSAVPSFVRWLTYMPIKTFPSEERAMRGMGLIYNEYYKRYEAGDRDALREFYQIYPEYRFRQLAFRYWDVASGKMTDDDWDEWVRVNNRVNEFYAERAELERERQKFLQESIPGSPEHYRTYLDFGERRRGISEKYEDELTTYFDFLADNRRQFIQWRDGPKARAMREWLDRWYAADPIAKDKMLAELPKDIIEIAREIDETTDKRLFTELEARQELVRNDAAVDAVYRELNHQASLVWDKYHTTDWWNENTTAEVRDTYAAYLEMEFPTNLQYRENHPELDKALNEYQQWRDDLLATIINPASPAFMAEIKLLHPNWDAEKLAETTALAADIGAFSVANFTYIKGTDRSMVINELWRFWTTLPDRSLARKRAKEILGPRFSEVFLAGKYGEISDYELALWLNILPDEWTSLVPPGRREPFGAGPRAMSESEMLMAARRLSQEEWDEMMGGREYVPPEPEEPERYEFAPEAIKTKSVEEATASAQTALAHAREQLRAGEPLSKIELPSPAEELEYQTAYEYLQRALSGETEFWDDPLVEKWFPSDSPARRFWSFWYNSVPPGKLGNWAKDHSLVAAVLDKVSREYIVEDAYEAALMFLIEELPNHDIGDPREYAQARAEAEIYYALATPQQEQLLNIYFNQLPDAKSKRAFLQAHPELVALFDAQNEFKAQHPIFTKYYDPDWVPRQQTAGVGTAGTASGTARSGFYQGQALSGMSWKMFVASAGPLAMGELFEYWSGRGELSASTRQHLETIWSASGTDLSFDDWLAYMKVLWLTMSSQSFKTPTPPKVYIPGVRGTAPRVTRTARWRIER